MLSSGNSALYISIINSRSNQPQPISPQVPANFIEMHIPQNMPRMRSRAQRRAEEKQAMKMTRVGGPTLYRPQISRAEFVGRIERQRNPALSERISDPAVPPALYEEFMLACNYDALTSAATDLFHQVAAGAWALSEYLPALHIGPPMTQAALVGVNTKNNKQRLFSMGCQFLDAGIDVVYKKTC